MQLYPILNRQRDNFKDGWKNRPYNIRHVSGLCLISGTYYVTNVDNLPTPDEEGGLQAAFKALLRNYCLGCFRQHGNNFLSLCDCCSKCSKHTCTKCGFVSSGECQCIDLKKEIDMEKEKKLDSFVKRVVVAERVYGDSEYNQYRNQINYIQRELRLVENDILYTKVSKGYAIEKFGEKIILMAKNVKINKTMYNYISFKEVKDWYFHIRENEISTLHKQPANDFRIEGGGEYKGKFLSDINDLAWLIKNQNEWFFDKKNKKLTNKYSNYKRVRKMCK